MTPATLNTIAAHLTDEEPKTVEVLALKSGYSIATVYAVIAVLGARRVRIGKNHYGYLSAPPPTIPEVEIDQLGLIDGAKWKDVAYATITKIGKANFADHLTPEVYAQGFAQMGRKLIELATHAEAVQDRPDWRIVLGFDTPTD